MPDWPSPTAQTDLTNAQTALNQSAVLAKPGPWIKNYYANYVLGHGEPGQGQKPIYDNVNGGVYINNSNQARRL